MNQTKKTGAIVFITFLLVLSIPAQIWLPWWITMVLSALGALLFINNALLAFALAFLIIGLEWLVVSLWMNQQNDFILAGKMAQIFTLNSPYVLIIIASLIGGISAGFAAASGSMLRSIFQK